MTYFFNLMIRENLDNGCKSATSNLAELNFFGAYHSLKPHILFYSNGLAILHGFPDITHVKVNNSKLAILNLTKLKYLVYIPP